MAAVRDGRIDDLALAVWRAITVKKFSLLELLAYGIAVSIFARPLGQFIFWLLGI